MAIGQFLCMKYIVLTKKKVPNISKVDISSLIFSARESRMLPIIATMPIETKNIPPNPIGYLPINDTPLLSKKPSSLVKVTLEPLTTINGTPIRVDQDTIKAAFGCCSPNKKVIQKTNGHAKPKH